MVTGCAHPFINVNAMRVGRLSSSLRRCCVILPERRSGPGICRGDGDGLTLSGLVGGVAYLEPTVEARMVVDSITAGNTFRSGVRWFSEPYRLDEKIARSEQRVQDWGSCVAT